MKISKLFHWLYAILMLLPIFAIGVTCAYVIFNKNAYQSYYGKTSNEVKYSNVTSYSQLNTENEYRFTLLTNQITNSSGSYIYFEDINVIDTNISDLPDLNLYNRFYCTWADNRVYLIFNSTTESSLTYNSISQRLQFDFTLVSYSQGAGANVSFSEKYDGMIQEITYIKDSYLSNVFYYSIEEVEQSSLFSWSYDSFLATPITYISDLFGIASNSPVILLMSYWLAISIIWLVFDLVMYMPLLVHRWLDKGVLE